jgi:hypothetical protein
MKRTVVRILTALAFIALGWAAGKAQTSQPDFEIVVEASRSEEATKTDVNVTCTKGCDLAWIERGVSANAKPTQTFTFGCQRTNTCSSYKIGGWIRR